MLKMSFLGSSLLFFWLTSSVEHHSRNEISLHRNRSTVEHLVFLSDANMHAFYTLTVLIVYSIWLFPWCFFWVNCLLWKMWERLTNIAWITSESEQLVFEGAAIDWLSVTHQSNTGALSVTYSFFLYEIN